MTNYQDGELLSMASTPDKEDVEWQAISYALKWAMGELVKHSYYIRTYCAIDELPEKILDAMAVALRTQYYDDSLDIATKRKLVKNSLNGTRRQERPQRSRSSWRPYSDLARSRNGSRTEETRTHSKSRQIHRSPPR